MADKTTGDMASTHEAATAGKEPSYSLERLSKDCRELFGVSASTFAGAACKLEADKKYTKAEMEKIIEDWGKTPVFAKDRKNSKGGK